MKWIECLFKMLMAETLSSLRQTRKTMAIPAKWQIFFSGTAGHDLRKLCDRALSDRNPHKRRLILYPNYFCTHWGVDLRYSTRKMEEKEAANILKIADGIIKLIHERA